MRLRSFEFSLRELAGSMGDFGTLFPLAIGYIVVCGMNPAGFLVMMGLTNIALGLIYKLPMPLQPKKVIAVTAIAQKWPPRLIYASGVGTGIVWLLLSLTGWIQKLANHTPKSVVRGIQIALGVMLGWQGLKWIIGWQKLTVMSGEWIINVILGVIAIVIVLTLRENKYAPAAVVLIVLGIVAVAIKGELLKVLKVGFQLPPITTFGLRDVFKAMLLAGFAQLPLTATNAIIATAALIKEYWPQRPVSEKKLALNMGVINVTVTFFGGMPMCHGAGGLAGQYYFGARTGGTNIIEGIIEISLGLFFSQAIVGLFGAFPMSIIGAMLFMVGIALAKYAFTLRAKDIIPATVTTVVSLIWNMAFGFIAGFLVYFAIKYYFRATGRCKSRSSLFELTPDSKM
ncbi:MAG: putative sulfate/molybdate transporter [Candidatus Poribacteria bacterium]